MSFAQLTNEFISMRPLFLISETFNYTGADQTWVVPTGVKTIWVDAYGAQGGNDAYQGGLGGEVKVLLTVTPGETLYVMVGGQPTGQFATYGNGGDAGSATTSSKISKAGGGMTALFRSSMTINNALVIAGGGGGGSAAKKGGNAGGTTAPTEGDILSGCPKTAGVGLYFLNGGGGTSISGGCVGATSDVQSVLPTVGLSGPGGKGGSVTTITHNSGGGGGGGYYGGGGGAGGGTPGGGGGGSSYATTTNSGSITHYTASNTGHGKLIIRYDSYNY